MLQECVCDYEQGLFVNGDESSGDTVRRSSTRAPMFQNLNPCITPAVLARGRLEKHKLSFDSQYTCEGFGCQAVCPPRIHGLVLAWGSWGDRGFAFWGTRRHKHTNSDVRATFSPIWCFPPLSGMILNELAPGLISAPSWRHIAPSVRSHQPDLHRPTILPRAPKSISFDGCPPTSRMMRPRA